MKITSQFSSYTQRNLFEILLNQTEIRLYIPLSDGFITKRTSVSFQIIQKMVNTIWFRFDLMRFRKKFSVLIGIVYWNAYLLLIRWEMWVWQPNIFFSLLKKKRLLVMIQTILQKRKQKIDTYNAIRSVNDLPS